VDSLKSARRNYSQGSSDEQPNLNNILLQAATLQDKIYLECAALSDRFRHVTGALDLNIERFDSTRKEPADEKQFRRKALSPVTNAGVTGSP
jgi:hypothetical protein